MPDPGDNHVDERHRDHELPREVHELVHAEARQRAANPDEREDDRDELGEEPHIRQIGRAHV